MTKPLRFVLLAASLALVVGLTGRSAVDTHAGGGTVINVTTTENENNDDGDCSLLEALQAANGNSPADACPAGVNNATGTDLISVPAGTYMTDTELQVYSNVDIAGAGANSTIVDGGGSTTVFQFGTKGLIIGSMSDLTVQNGSDNFGAGIDNLVGSELLLEQVHITNNTADFDGGGIRNSGTIEIRDSAITNNHSLGSDSGGGIFNNSGCIKCKLPSGVIALVNVTLSGNTADNGGALRNDGTAFLVHVTIYDNEATVGDGGLLNHGDMDLMDTIVAANSGGNCGGSEPIDSLGYNIEDTDTCDLDATGDQPNTDPMLGALAANGGPTQTHALLAGSPAIDTADDAACPATDQRGIARPQDGDDNGSAICDIGAYEVEAAVEPPPPGEDTIEGEVSDPNPDPGETVDVTVTVLDENGDPIAGVECAFSIVTQPGDDAALGSPTATTDENGNATVPLDVGSTPGLVEVEADCEGLTEVLAVNVGGTVLAPETGSAPADGAPAGAIALAVLLATAGGASLYWARRRSI